MVLSDGDTPTPTPSEDLTAVGSLQLASGDGSDLDRFYAKVWSLLFSECVFRSM